MSTTLRNAGYALLIGVDDYSIYDASVQSPSEVTSGLRGSVNDVRSWYELCRELGYPAENIRVLASPEISRPRLEGAIVGPATSDAIREGVAWLAEKLGADHAAAGVLTFSGHGGGTPRGLVLCPTDVKQDGDDLVNVVHLLGIQAVLASKDAGRNLTSVFDCCRASVGTNEPTRLERALRVLNQELVTPAIGERMFFGAEPGAVGFQAELGGRWHGAFTWAFMTIESRWPVREGANGARELSISHEDMRQRTGDLLSALGFDQKPALVCRESALGMPVFHRGPATKDDLPSEECTAPEERLQLDSGNKGYRRYRIEYQIGTNGDWVQIGYVNVPNTRNTIHGITYSPGTEYWYLTANVPSTATRIRFTWWDYDWSSGYTTAPLSFTMPEAVSWTLQSSSPRTSPSLFVNNGNSATSPVTPPVSLQWSLTHTGTSWTSGWGGSLVWYNNTGQSNVFGYSASAEYYMPGNIAASSSVTWYEATAVPVNAM